MGWFAWGELRMQGVDPFIGTQFTSKSGSIITAIKYIGKPGHNKIYSFHCSACSLDSELWPEGSITSAKSNMEKGSIPCGCGARHNWSREQYEIRAARSASDQGFKFLGWVGEYNGSYTYADLDCATHGKFKCRFSNLMLGKACALCGLKKISDNKRFPDEILIDKFSELCNLSDWQRIIRRVGAKSWLVECKICAADEYSSAGLKSKFVATACSLYNGSFACRCSTRYRWSNEERACRASSVCEADGLEFIGWSETRKTTLKNVAIVKCVSHGEFKVPLWSLLFQNTRCPSCTGRGFNSTKPAFVYLLKSDCGAYTKVGISGSFERRMLSLKGKTPFAFEVLDKIEFKTGADAREAEQDTHCAFESAGLSGFEGCTEWMRSDPGISQYVKQRAL